MQLDNDREAKRLARLERTNEKAKRDAEEMSKYFMQEYPKLHLFKGLEREFVCSICLKPNDVIKCSSATCNEQIHRSCAEAPPSPQSVLAKQKKVRAAQPPPPPLATDIVHVTGEDLPSAAAAATPVSELAKPIVTSAKSPKSKKLPPPLCLDCRRSPSEPICYVCKETVSAGDLLKCTERFCARHYHMGCLKLWPQTKVVAEHEHSLFCPRHVCHTCISDNPRGKHYTIENNKLTKCVLCLATYHIDSCCVPAGSVLLTATQLICPRHRVEHRRPINANWCFICSKGGHLVCCETCPTAFHAECLRIQLPDSYICEECETGRLPLYGEMVWAKIGSCRWWPAIVLPPTSIPDNVEVVKHERHDFCVRFFGTNDYSWISRGFVFLYQEGDSDYAKVDDSSARERAYVNALEKAREWYIKLMSIKEKIEPNSKSVLKPLPYVKIKTNRPIPPVRLNDADDEESNHQCMCNAQDPCGPTSGCLNRLLMYECSPDCAAGPKCENQRFQKQLYPPLLEKHIGMKGFGLVTTVPIASGSFIIEYVGELINHKELERRVQQKQASKDEYYYFLTVSRDLTIDAGPRGNAARFINHSCEPNCETQLWTVMGNVRVGLFAVKDIPEVSFFFV